MFATWSVAECGAPSLTPSLPHPVTVARVPGSRSSEGSGRQIEPILARGFTCKIEMIRMSSRLTMTHLSVQPEQGHVVCWLRLQEAVIPESEDIGEVRMEEDLGGVIPLDGVILGEPQQVVLAQNHLSWQI